jgi:hypothetical protein
MAEDITETVLQELRKVQPEMDTLPAVAKKSFRARLFDFIDEPFTLGALFLLGGIVGRPALHWGIRLGGGGVEGLAFGEDVVGDAAEFADKAEPG